MSLLCCLWEYGWEVTYMTARNSQMYHWRDHQSMSNDPAKVISLKPLEGLQIAQQVRALPLSSNCYLLCFFYFLILTGIPSLSRREKNSYTNPDCGEVQNSLPWFWTLPIHLCSTWSTNHALPCQETTKLCMSSQLPHERQNTYVLKLACSIGK